MENDKWFFDKKNLKWLFGILIGLLIILFLVASIFFNKQVWIKDCIGFICGIASLFGIMLALFQSIDTRSDVDYVKEKAEAAQRASEETQKSIKKTLSIAKVSKYCEQIKIIQEHIEQGDLSLVIHLSCELQDMITELKYQINQLHLNFSEDVISEYIKQLGININLIRKENRLKSKRYNKDAIIRDFDEILNLLFELKSQLTQ